MKKALALIFVMSLTVTYAQDFEKGGNYINIGFGLDPYYHSGVGNGNAWGTWKRTAIGPIVVGYEHGISDVLGIGRIGVGAIVGQAWYTRKYKYNNLNVEESYTTSRLSIIPRAAYHFEFNVDKMDVYAGVGAGVHISTDKGETYNGDPFNPQYTTYRTTSVGFGHYVFAGIRYYFTPAFGVYAEAGHGLNALNGGLVFAF